ncbi:MAG: putative phosphothreonine lyase domain-containing protein [Janthinobacterium lividum]
MRGGKWLIFIDEKVDEAWARIVEALEAGRLGSTAKVSTAKPSQSSTEAAFVICVYTSSNDEADVWRVRDGLRAAGFEMRLGWKSDDATRRVVGDRVHKPSEVYTFMDEA